MNNYEAKQQARKDRYLAKSQGLAQQADATYDRARTMAEAIPFGQPILIGHHSETRDRNYRNRIHTTYGKAFEQQDKADHYAQKAASVGTGGISSDDPDAIDKLKEQLTQARDSQDMMKKANAAIRKHKADQGAQINLSAFELHFCHCRFMPKSILHNIYLAILRGDDRSASSDY